jgi:hypothetical protein
MLETFRAIMRWLLDNNLHLRKRATQQVRHCGPSLLAFI